MDKTQIDTAIHTYKQAALNLGKAIEALTPVFVAAGQALQKAWEDSAPALKKLNKFRPKD